MNKALLKQVYGRTFNPATFIKNVFSGIDRFFSSSAFWVLILMFFFSVARPQFIDYPHSELKWKSFDTPHFTIHFHNGTANTAYQVAQIAEEIYQPLTSLYNYKPGGKIHFIIKDTDDYSNGGAFFFDDKVEIWASNLDYIMRGTKNWLRDVVTHEFSHMISIQAMVKSNLTIPYGFFQVFGYEKERRKDVVRGFPNTLVSYPLSSINIPIWFAEGVAQHQAPGARYDYRDPHREMIVRDRLRYDQLLTYNQMTVFGKDSHGNESSYNLGFSFVNYLTQRFGEGILADITKTSAKWNSYTFESVLQKTTGVDAEQLYAGWKDSLKTVYGRRLTRILENKVTGEKIQGEGAVNIYPIWSPEGSKIAFVSNRGEDYFSKNCLILQDLNTRQTKTLVSGIASSLSWSPDGRYLAYARTTRNRQGSAFNDLFLYDLNQDKEIRLTQNLRGSNPDFSRDGKKLVFVSASNGLHQLNIFHLPDNPEAEAATDIYIETETGRLVQPDDHNSDDLRKANINGRIEQVLSFADNRQIYHPRWAQGDSCIIFDTAVEYGRDIARFNLNSKSFEMLFSGREEERYPALLPGSDWLYYAASTTGIYNIYRVNLSTGARELLTNVPGGAMMPAVNAEGDLLYACYDSVGYKVYMIRQPQAVNADVAIYDSDYLSTIPEKNFINNPDRSAPLRNYRRTFPVAHVMPRILIDYGTVKPGFYVFTGDVLNKYNLVGGIAVNSDFDYDLYGYAEVNDFILPFFIEVYNSSANLKNDTLQIPVNETQSLTYRRDVSFDLTEARIGLGYRLLNQFDIKAAYIWRNYNAKIDQKSLFNPYTRQTEPPFTFHYNYLRGSALEWWVVADMIHPDKHSEINPTRGRYVYFRHGLEFNDFLNNFAISSIGLKEIYKNYTYHEFELDWEEYFSNPVAKSHGLSIRLRAGYIDRPIDSFFNLFAGGLLGLKGYSFYSIEGRHKVIGNITYRIPVWRDIDKRLGHIYLDKIYAGLFYEYGNAWSGDARITDFKRDVGMQLRLDTFSYGLFPTRFFAEAVYPLDEAENANVLYKQEWRFYFGALYEFELRERMGRLFQLPGRLF